MNCWSILGVPADADERTIKRSYAALLKEHRPDEDLDAFQRLREAYEQALLILRRHEGQGEHIVSSIITPVPPRETSLGPISAALTDISPANLDAVSAEAKAAGNLAQFERLLLERCLSDNEWGYQAAHWALVRLGWLTPCQSSELPAAQLAALAHRLIATELHDLHHILVTDGEERFLDRVRILYGQEWLQAFDHRTEFSQGVAGILIDSPSWSQPLFDSVREVCGWSENSFDQRAWELLTQRGEGAKLKERLLLSLNVTSPSVPEQRAAWLLLRSLKDADRRRLVDSFGDADWQSCLHLEHALIRHPEVVDELSDSGMYSWRIWLPKDTREATYQYLLAIYMAIFLVGSILDGWIWEKGIAPLALSAVVFFLLRIFVIASFDFHEGWSEFYRKASGLDIYLSRLLLSNRLVRDGLGILIFRHVVPALYVGLFAGLMACVGPAAIAPFIGGTVTLIALWYVDRVAKGWIPKPLFSANSGFLGNLWGQVGIGIFAIAVFAVVIFIGSSKKSAVQEIHKKNVAPVIESLLGECTWTKQYNGECEMPLSKQVWKSQ